MKEALQERIINEENEQVKNKKTTTNNKTMQTQQSGKWTQYKWIVAQKCLQKKKVRNLNNK